MRPRTTLLTYFVPSGQQLAFMSFREGYCSVFVMNADGSDQHNLTPMVAGDANSTWCSRAPSWTRSGRILFLSVRSSTGGDIEVFRRRLISNMSHVIVALNLQAFLARHASIAHTNRA